MKKNKKKKRKAQVIASIERCFAKTTKNSYARGKSKALHHLLASVSDLKMENNNKNKCKRQKDQT